VPDSTVSSNLRGVEQAWNNLFGTPGNGGILGAGEAELRALATHLKIEGFDPKKGPAEAERLADALHTRLTEIEALPANKTGVGDAKAFTAPPKEILTQAIKGEWKNSPATRKALFEAAAAEAGAKPACNGCDHHDKGGQKPAAAQTEAAAEAGAEAAQNGAKAAGRPWYKILTHTKESKFSKLRTAGSAAGAAAAILAARYALSGDDKNAETWQGKEDQRPAEAGVAGQGR
jgi:hypothetical protein